MRGHRLVRILQAIALGLVMVSATVGFYRFYVGVSGDLLRAPLIAASIAGILFIIIAPNLIRIADRPK